MKLFTKKTLTKLVAVTAMAVSVTAMALPDTERTRIYYSDAAHTTTVGERLVVMCGIGVVNHQLWGTTSSYYETTTDSCGGTGGPGNEDPIHCDYFRDVFC
ncbi:MAG: hypothetical protein MJK04_21500 [Psychrosphaera sp.]|nr:hypothetical protein [Psychrosphaera sp.]